MFQNTFVWPERRTALAVAGVGAIGLAASLPAGPRATAVGALFFLLACGGSFWEACAPVVIWSNVVGALLLIIWLIPIKAYSLPVHLGFNLEAYRLFLVVLIFGWVIWALSGDGRFSACGLAKPLVLLTATALASQIVNFHSLAAKSSDSQALKSLSYFLGFLLAFALICSTTSSWEDVERLVRVLVLGGAVVAVFALYESRTRTNVFDQLDRWVPFLEREPREVTSVRAGQLRVKGSAQHPIALSCALTMIVPLAIYLAGQAASRLKSALWISAATVAAVAAFATISRTTVVMLVLMGLVALWLRGRAVVRAWPLLILLPFVIHFATPGALGGVRKAFFPEGGLVADLQGREELSGSGRFSDLDPGLRRWEQAPFVGHGLGSQAATGADPAALQEKADPLALTEPVGVRLIFDNQYLNTLVELGILGLIGAVWFVWSASIKLARAAHRNFGKHGDLLAACAVSCAGFGASLLLFDAFAFVQATLVFFIVAAIGLRARELVIERDSIERQGAGA